MELSNILNGINSKFNNDININGISVDSREIKEGNMFIAINGFEMDGHKFIESAINNGAKAVLIDEERYEEFKDVNAEVITVTNTRDVKMDSISLKKDQENDLPSPSSIPNGATFDAWCLDKALTQPLRQQSVFS